MKRQEEFKLDKHVAVQGSSGSRHRFSLRKAYDSLLERADKETKEKALELYHDAIHIRSIGLVVEPMRFANASEESDLVEEKVYMLSAELFGEFEEKPLSDLKNWAERVYCGNKSHRIYRHLEGAYQHLLEADRIEEALNFALLLGRCYLSGGERALAVHVFNEIHNMYCRTKGMTDPDTMFALHRLGWVYFETDQIDLAKDTFQQELNLRLNSECKESPGILSCQEAIRLLNR